MIVVPVIAIFDIGKTNKKFFLIDESYRIVSERSVHFNEITDEDGDACDDVQLLSQWLVKTLTDILDSKKFEVRAVNFSAYGASLVYIDEKGQVAAPLYSYLKEYPRGLKNGLYKKYGGADKISCETASPVLGSLNSGMQLYRMKIEKPLLYKQIKYALHLPQYMSYLVTKKPVSDITSIGCHTQLWDFKRNDYHRWVKAEGVDKKLAPVTPSTKCSLINFSREKIKVGPGLHDSSAALIPYLSVFKESFVLISTGTWCISLSAFNNSPLSSAELKKDCLCYLEYQGRPVKASRLFAGNEHEQQVKRLAAHFNKPVSFYKRVKYDPSIINNLKETFSFKTKSASGKNKLNSSFFNERDLNELDSYEVAYHCLLLDIMQQQYASTQLVISGSPVSRIFVDGGFGNNPVYMHLLALAFPGLEVYAASVAQATAMGAALAIHKHWNRQPVPADMVKLKYYKAADIAETGD